MKNLKASFYENGPEIIRKLGVIINPLLLTFKKETNQLLVFYFHGLYNSEKEKKSNHIDPQNNMTVDQFVDFIEYFLDHNYNFIKPENLLDRFQEDKRYIMITFDDGYYNNMLSLEILNKYKIPAIFFLATKNIKEDKSFWWDVIYKYRIKGGSNLESIRKEQRFLKSFNHRYICEYIENMFGVESFKPWSEIDRPLSENEVQSISVNPYVSIGNHTHNHAILTNCERQEIKYEINECNKILNDLTGKIPSIISFPNGNFNKLILEITEDEGFHFAFTTQQEINRLPVSPDKLLCLNRFVTGTDKITKAGGFYRLGYDPDLLFSSLKVQISSFIKGTKH